MFRLCAFAISTIVYVMALACAPSTESLNSQFLRPNVNGRMAFSLRLLVTASVFQISHGSLPTVLHIGQRFVQTGVSGGMLAVNPRPKGLENRHRLSCPGMSKGVFSLEVPKSFFVR